MNTIKRRNRKSMFDEYKDEITIMLVKGFKYTEIIAVLGEGYTYQGLVAYCRVNGLMYQPASNEKTLKCRECSDCLEYKTTCNKNGRVCLIVKRGIPNPSMYLSPVWCPKRKGDFNA